MQLDLTSSFYIQEENITLFVFYCLEKATEKPWGVLAQKQSWGAQSRLHSFNLAILKHCWSRAQHLQSLLVLIPVGTTHFSPLLLHWLASSREEGYCLTRLMKQSPVVGIKQKYWNPLWGLLRSVCSRRWHNRHVFCSAVRGVTSPLVTASRSEATAGC